MSKNNILLKSFFIRNHILTKYSSQNIYEYQNSQDLFNITEVFWPLIPYIFDQTQAEQSFYLSYCGVKFAKYLYTKKWFKGKSTYFLLQTIVTHGNVTVAEWFTNTF